MKSVETEIAEINVILKEIKETTATIHTGIYGNGTKGLKARVAVLETKFWILIVLLVPVSVCALEFLLRRM